MKTRPTSNKAGSTFSAVLAALGPSATPSVGDNGR